MRIMPIIKPPLGLETIPMDILSIHHAKQIHGQTLGRLAERGGLSIKEAAGNIKKLSYLAMCSLPDEDAIKIVNSAIEKAKGVKS